MNLAALAASPPAWRAEPMAERGENEGAAGLLFAREVRLRNFKGLPFWVSASQEACARVVERAREQAAARGFGEGMRLAEMSAEARGVLRERDLLPEDPATFEGKRDFKHFFPGPDATRHALLGETEHWIEIEVLPTPRAGAQVETRSGEDFREEAFSRSPRYGALTSDPGFAGLGLRLEAGVHLPGLVSAGELPAARRALGALGYELRPLGRAAGAAEAGFFRIVSRGGLGLSEAELRAGFAAKVDALLRADAEALGRRRGADPARFDDAAHRAEALLRGARRVEYAELLAWISSARAGRRAGSPGGIPEAALEALRVRAQPFHLAAENPGSPPEQEASLRADLARALLG